MQSQPGIGHDTCRGWVIGHPITIRSQETSGGSYREMTQFPHIKVRAATNVKKSIQKLCRRRKSDEWNGSKEG